MRSARDGQAVANGSLNAVVAVVVLLLVARAAVAAPFQNGSFELGAPNVCNIFNIPVGDNTTITGWTVIQGNIDWEGPPPCGWLASDGNNSLDLVGNQTKGGVEQTFDTVSGQTYQVSFDLAGNYGGPPVVKPLVVSVAGDMHSFSFDTSGASQFDMNWITKKFSFVATSSSTTISFVSDLTGLGGTNAGAALDNVRIDQGVAAPTIGVTGFILVAILLLGLGSLLLRRRARRLAF